MNKKMFKKFGYLVSLTHWSFGVLIVPYSYKS